ncbi:MAG: fibronectin type III domain-containing protein [Oscillospiraceae bacterium]|nr:fibronectin type III domain-containing protein [Oscillospiraceae bacterium]
MKKLKFTTRATSIFVVLLLLVQIVSQGLFFSEPIVANAAETELIKATEPFAVDYDPNDGIIKYGHSGEIGMSPKNDLDVPYEEDSKTVFFPSQVAESVDENGNLLFPDYDPSDPYYDYTDMFNKALEIARKRDNADVFVEDGVYYFEKSVYLFGYTKINANAGKVAFVIKPYFKDIDGNDVEVSGFFTNANLDETYSWYFSSINDITFVVEDTHETFKPTSSVDTILDNLCSDDIQPVDNYSLFYRIVTKYAGIHNLAVSGFECFMRWTRIDMLTRVTNCTVGPTKYVYWGVDTNDAFFYDNYYYGGYYTDSDGLSQLPVFQITFNMGTTVFANSYIGNYYFSRNGAGCWCPHTTYSNITFERVYNFVMDTTTEASSSVSGCYFKDCAYNDIAKYFEDMGIPAFDFWDRTWSSEENRFIYHSKGYIIRDTITGNKLDSANHSHGQYISLIQLHSGVAFTQNKIECDSLEWTTLVRLTDSEWTSRYDARRNANNLYFSDNAFKINDWEYENLMIDDWKGGKPYTEGWYDKTIIEWGERGWNNADGTPAMGYVGVEGPDHISWLDEGVYVSPTLGRYIDLSAFVYTNKPTAGYAKLGEVGADEEQLEAMGIEDRYYQELNSGNYEIVSFKEDFGGFDWNFSSNHEKLQEAFDYVATHDAILYIEEGTYRTDKPIVLRGGATYRIISKGTIEANKTAEIKGNGVFVMSGDDNAPIDGYFYGVSAGMNGADTSAFYNVNFENFFIQFGSVQRGVGCFTNCNIKDCVFAGGTVQYCNYGFFYKTVTDNLLLKYVYGTASTGVEGEDGITPGDINYKFFISNSDFTNSTWRGCWLEFGQFSNGKKLSGKGNSLYRGNIIDYSFNYSFGRNDVVCGNTMTRAGYGSITNHMLNSNFPIDLPDALTNKPMVMFHVSDGLRLIGNTDIGTMSNECHFVEFDSPTIRYKDSDGNEVVSISDVRIAGNLVYTTYRGDYKINYPITPYGKADNIVLENCKNNSINLHTFYFIDQVDNPETTDIDETLTVTKEQVRGWSIPKTITYVNGERLVVDYPVNNTPENLTEIKTSQPAQDKIFDVPNKWLNQENDTEYILFDFKDRSDAELSELKKQFVDFIDRDTIMNYIRSDDNKAVFENSSEKLPFTYDDIKNLSETAKNNILMQTLKYDVTDAPDGENSFFIDSSRDVTDGRGNNNNAGNSNNPTYAVVFRDDELMGDNLTSVTGSYFQDMYLSYAWMGHRMTVLIYAEDDDYYYGVGIGYNESPRGCMYAEYKIEKNYLERLGKFGEVHHQTGAWSGTKYGMTNYDPYADIVCPDNGGQDRYIYADFTTTKIFGEGHIENFDSTNIGVDFTVEYNDTYETVSVYATLNFEEIGTDNSHNPGLVATTRKIWIGTFDIADKDKIFGIWGGDKAWIESVQFECEVDEPSQCNHSFETVTTREGHCTKEAVVRHTCKLCGYQYEEHKKAPNHNFYDVVRLSDNMTIRTCSECGFKYSTDEPPIKVCKHTDCTETLIEGNDCLGKIIELSCNICNDHTEVKNVEPLGHDYEITVHEPTLDEEGYTEHICSRCNDSYKDGFTSKLEVSAPADFKVAEKTTSTVKLSWKKSANADGYIIEQYNAGKARNADWVLVKVIADADETEFIIDGLESETEYSFRIRAYSDCEDETHYSDWSEVTVKTEAKASDESTDKPTDDSEDVPENKPTDEPDDQPADLPTGDNSDDEDDNNPQTGDNIKGKIAFASVIIMAFMSIRKKRSDKCDEA